MTTHTTTQNDQREGLAVVLVEQFERHQYAVGYEGIASDGEVAWLKCTCGWSENYEMPEDDIRLAERQWEKHQASAFAAALTAQEGERGGAVVTAVEAVLGELHATANGVTKAVRAALADPAGALAKHDAEVWNEGWNAAVDSDGHPGDVNPYHA